jgi:hypothetical protein
MAKMLDGEVTDRAYKSLIGDLDHIEADGLFAEQDNPASDTHKDVKIEAHGVKVSISPMDGEQTKDMPKVEDDDDADKGPVKLGK